MLLKRFESSGAALGSCTKLRSSALVHVPLYNSIASARNPWFMLCMQGRDYMVICVDLSN